ncbi:MAG: Stk1 family PASTA domain-containing Ser/Thr kinase [Lachnospiraceae bacterium]|nr:Stk1 family PASTA domain-containing Ser/Thr kinase [Lachnospiraceae bacterium]
MINIGTLVADRYEILDKIGTGGMSDVYKAKDHKLNRLVAVKMLKTELSENADFVSKFRVEAQAAAGLMHPNVVNVYDVGEEKGVNYIVMELVDGITLKKYIEKKARLSVKEAISIAIQVSMGLEAAHKNHIIHRDIKPQNIIISKEGKVKVTDFGIAKAATSNTITSNVMGSVHYTSPEQARGGYSDEKSDIYSLGVTIFEMLTGRVPFTGETTVAIAIKHIQSEMPSPCEYVPEIPVSVEQIVMKCCEKSPDRRYQNMSDLIADLKQSLLHPDDDFVKVIREEEISPTMPIEDLHAREEYPQEPYDEPAPYEEEPYEEDRYGRDYYEQEEYPEDYEEVPEEPVRKRKVVRKKKETVSKPRRKKVVRKVYEDEYESPGIDSKWISLVIILGAVLIGMLVIFFAARRLGLIGGENDPAPASSAPPIIIEQEASENVPAETGTPASTEETQAAEDDVVVPNVVDQKKDIARGRLEYQGFKVNVMEKPDDEIEKDYVISQDPAGQSTAKEGSVITLTVSTGPDTEGKVRVPNLLYRTEEEVRQILEDNELTLGEITYVDAEEAAHKGRVITQSVPDGEYIEKEEPIDLTIGKKSYMYASDITAPTAAEDPQYAAGTPVYVVIWTASGEKKFDQVLSTLPYPVQFKGMSDDHGRLEMAYTNILPDGTAQQQHIVRELTFTAE